MPEALLMYHLAKIRALTDPAAIADCRKILLEIIAQWEVVNGGTPLLAPGDVLGCAIWDVKGGGHFHAGRTTSALAWRN